MPHRATRFLPLLVGAIAVAAAACGGKTTQPSSVTYAGEWSGTTSQGTPMTFTVSSEQKLTRLTLNYNFNGCAGSATFAPSVPIAGIPTSPVPVGSLAYESGPVGTPNRTLVTFLFTSPTDAHGMAVFVDFAGCGAVPTTAAWNATRR